MTAFEQSLVEIRQHITAARELVHENFKDVHGKTLDELVETDALLLKARNRLGELLKPHHHRRVWRETHEWVRR